MITSDQIRAARALKNWSQTDLSVRTGLATPTIANIELGKQKPSSETLDKIVEAFLVGGVEFTASGVSFIDDTITFLYANEGRKYHHIMLDALSLLSKGDEVLYLGCDDRRSPPDIVAMEEKMEKAGIICRKIIAEDNIFIQGPPEHSRQASRKYLTFGDVITIYANKVASVIPPTTDNDKWTYMIVKNQFIADDYRRIFKFFWDNSKPLKKWKDIRDFKTPMLPNYSTEELEKLAEE